MTQFVENRFYMLREVFSTQGLICKRLNFKNKTDLVDFPLAAVTMHHRCKYFPEFMKQKNVLQEYSKNV